MNLTPLSHISLTCFQIAVSLWFMTLFCSKVPLIFTVGSANICNFGACVSLTQSCLVQQTFQGIEQALPPFLNTLNVLLSSGVTWTKLAVQKEFVFADNSLRTEGAIYLFSLQVREIHLLLQSCRLNFFPSSKDKMNRKSKFYLKSGLLALCFDGF